MTKLCSFTAGKASNHKGIMVLSIISKILAKWNMTNYVMRLNSIPNKFIICVDLNKF